MKRTRPKQHTRVIKTKKGRKKITVNRGVRSRSKKKVTRRREEQMDMNSFFPQESEPEPLPPYQYKPKQVAWVQGVINNKMESNRGLGFMASRAREKLEKSKTIRDKQFYDEKLTSIRRQVRDNNLAIERLEKQYELGKYRRPRS